MLLAGGPHTWQPFARHRQICGSIPSFSPKLANEAGGVSQAPDDEQPLGLLGPYHRHAISTFNTCYNLGGAGLPHTHSPTFPTSCLPFPLVAPLGLHFNQVPAINQSLSFKEPMAATWSFDHSTTYHSLHLCLAIANDLSLVEGSQG
jgi:hypothetical protein